MSSAPPLDPRGLPKGWRTPDIYTPDLHIDTIKVKTRDFRWREMYIANTLQDLENPSVSRSLLTDLTRNGDNF